MEPHQRQQNSSQLEKISATNSATTSSYLCRQSSTRWTPTTEQITLLKELYYINGVRSPTADQIQAICARLRRYGKIEGKNVFYWFQNHKARERQKKRLISSGNNEGIINCCKQDEVSKCPYIYSNGTNNNPGESFSSSSTKDNKYRDGSIPGGIFYGTAGNVNDASQWTAIGGTNYFSTYTAYNFNGNISTINEDHHDQQGHYYVTASEIETLPLFPMHNEDNHLHSSDYHFPSNGYHNGAYSWSSGGGSNNDTSLELSLNSYGYGCYSYTE